jgi:hypothetical protein
MIGQVTFILITLLVALQALWLPLVVAYLLLICGAKHPVSLLRLHFKLGPLNFSCCALPAQQAHLRQA